MKLCSKCREWKQLDSFYNCKTSPDGRQYSCAECQLEIVRKRHAINPQKRRDQYARWISINAEKKRISRTEYNKKNAAKNAAYASQYRRRNLKKYSEIQARIRAKETPDKRAARLAYLAKYQRDHKEELSKAMKLKRATATALRGPRPKLPSNEAKKRQRAANTRYNERNREKKRLETAKRRASNPKKARALWIADAARRKARKLGNQIGNPKIISEWEITWKRMVAVRCYWCGVMKSPTQCHADHVEPLSKGGAHSIENLCISCQPCNAKKSAKPLAAWNASLTAPVLF